MSLIVYLCEEACPFFGGAKCLLERDHTSPHKAMIHAKAPSDLVPLWATGSFYIEILWRMPSPDELKSLTPIPITPETLRPWRFKA